MPFISSVRGSYGPQRFLGKPPTSVITGGNITTSGGYRIHTFDTVGSDTLNLNSYSGFQLNVEYLVVAGGGAGSARHHGGGGAGGYRTGSLTISTPQSVSVGNGGIGGRQDSPTNPSGTPGGPSVFSSITSTGGGSSNAAGGSGGGANAFPYTAFFNPAANGSIAGQGNPGGSGYNIGAEQTYRGGGGGGAGAAGGSTPTSGSSDVGGFGGAGLTSSISGSPLAYAGGGGGAPYSGSSPGGSGVGGTGNAGLSTAGSGTNARGGGGGSAGFSGGSNGQGGSGGSGIVIVRYLQQ